MNAFVEVQFAKNPPRAHANAMLLFCPPGLAESHRQGDQIKWSIFVNTLSRQTKSERVSKTT
jgi:hypothetical protein